MQGKPADEGKNVAAESEGRKRAAYSDRIVVLDGNGEGHGDYRAADKTIEFLRQFKDRPLFIGCGFVKPHSPPTAPQKFFDLYDLDKITLPPDFASKPTVPPGFPEAAIRKRNADLFIGRESSEREAKEMIRAYLASISWVDWNIGRVLAELDKLGLRENMIVVFVADHGYQLGEKGKWSKAGSLFEMSARVPLIVSAPGMKGNGQTCARIVESLDIYPTLWNSPVCLRRTNWRVKASCRCRKILRPRGTSPPTLFGARTGNRFTGWQCARSNGAMPSSVRTVRRA